MGAHRPRRRPQVGPGALIRPSSQERLFDDDPSPEAPPAVDGALDAPSLDENPPPAAEPVLPSPPSLPGGAEEVRPRVVRVLPDEPAIDKLFDYAVPSAMAESAQLGAVVRIDLHGRRVGGWIVDADVVPDHGVALRPLAKVSGWGPSEDLIDLASWAAWRWAGRPASFLRTASPERVVRSLPAPGPATTTVPTGAAGDHTVVADALAGGPRVVRMPPSSDGYELALGAARLGNALLLVPGIDAARHLALRLRRAGVEVALLPHEWAAARSGATVIGARAAAWAPVRDLAAVVVFDEHDETWQQEQAPTWHARDVALERAARAGVPCALVSPMPTLEALAAGLLVTPTRSEERAGWPMVDVVDRQDEQPGRGSLFSDKLVTAVRSGRRVVCVLNVKGRSRLLACAACGDLARCEVCDGSMVQRDPTMLICRRCDTERPPVCLSCSGTKFKNLVLGVSRVREELEALARTPVVEVTAESPLSVPRPDSARATRSASDEPRVFVGTEAVLHQVRDAEVVAFLDFDQELLAPRYRAAEEAFALLVRAARLVGGRDGEGRLLIQTRLPSHEVVQAALLGDPSRVSDAEQERREALRFPPASAMAVVSGASAAAYMVGFGHPPDVEVLGPVDGRWMLRAPEHGPLLDALAATPRPGGRLRLEVDPLRL